MQQIPHTTIEGLSVPRLIAGTNWFLGYSHQTQAKSAFIKEYQTREKLADLLEVFFAAGANAVYGGRPEAEDLENAIRDAEDRTGRGAVKICIPSFDLDGTEAARDANLRTLDAFAASASP